MGEFEDNMTLRDAAEELAVSKSRVEQFVRDGRLPIAAAAGGIRWVSRKKVAELKRIPRKGGRPRQDVAGGEPTAKPAAKRKGGKGK